MLRGIKNLPVLYSITNSTATPAEYLDKYKPFDFFTFLKYMPPAASTNVSNEHYREYITAWAAVNNYNEEQESKLTQNLYVELLKDISINYLTYEEKRAIATTDFNNKQEIEIILPFYSRKLREICDFYNKKREDLKQQPYKIKSRGTVSSVSRSIYDSINEYVFTADDENLTYNYPPINLEVLADKLSIEIEELYDLYSNYFDVYPQQQVDAISSGMRATYFSHNVNDLEYNIFVDFDDAVKQYIIDNTRVYLTSLAENFSVFFNTNLINLNCRVGDPLYTLVTGNKEEASAILTLRKKLIEKYIGTDIHYISAGDTIDNIKTGVLIKAENPTGNLLNRHFPTAAALDDVKNLVTLRKLGLFFKPEKFGLLQFSVPENRYKIDKSKVSPNTIYVFPDPSMYGDTTGLTNTTLQSPVMHVHKYTRTIQNEATFFTEGDPQVLPISQSFYAYTSKQQFVSRFELGNDSLKSNFLSIVNKGIVKHWCEDIFGDQYLHIETQVKKPINDITTPDTQLKYEYRKYDGGIITFADGSSVPERSIADSPSWVFPDIYSSEYYYNALFDGSVGALQNNMMVRGMLGTRTFDGWNFTQTDFTNTEDAVIFNPFNVFYNVSSVDGGYFNDTVAVTADFTLNYAFSSIQYERLDGDIITHDNSYVLGAEDKNFFIDNVYPNQKSTTYQDDTLSYESIVYVRDVITSQIYQLSSHKILKRYHSEVVEEILNFKYFDVYKDTIYFRTKNYFIADKILSDKDYLNLTAKRNILQLNLSTPGNRKFIVPSKPFFFEDNSDAVLGGIECDNVESNGIILKPVLYRISNNTADIQDVNITHIKGEDYVSPLNVKVIKIENPKITYNSRVRLYSMTATLFDKNNLCYFYQVFFELQAKYANIKGCRLICLQTNSVIKTINWKDEINYNMLNVNTNLNNITTTYTSISVNSSTRSIDIYETSI